MAFDRVTVDPDKMGGVPSIRGLLITAATVVGIVADGMGEEEILEAYLDLERKIVARRCAREGLIRYRAPAKACAACSLRAECTDNKQGRAVHRHPEEHYPDMARARLGTGVYEKAMRKRKVWAEPPFAEAKRWHGMDRFRLRALERVNCEVLIVATG